MTDDLDLFTPAARIALPALSALIAAIVAVDAIHRGPFSNVRQPVRKIDHFVTAYNATCQPFRWTATADAILEKLHRLCSRITGTGH
ncbi:hypothetical protein [Bradyrhizobium sp. USDA 4503]